MIDTEKLMEKVKKEGREEGREEGKIESAIGIIKMFMGMGMTIEESFSEILAAIQLSPDSIQRLKEEFKLK